VKAGFGAISPLRKSTDILAISETDGLHSLVTMNWMRWAQTLALTACLTACGDSEPVVATQPGQPETVEQPAPPPCQLVMGWDPWEPYQYEIAGGDVFGLDVDLLTAVTRNTGCNITFQKGSWRELLQLVMEGRVDLLAGATRTTQREDFAYFTRPYRDEEFVLYVRAASLAELQGKSLEQMLADGLQIGVIDDYLYGDPVTSLQDNSDHSGQFIYSPMAEINFSRLLDGQVGGIIEDKYVGAAIIRHKNLNSSVARHPQEFGSRSVSIMVSKASVNQELFDQIDQSVQLLSENGAIDKILAQYQSP